MLSSNETILNSCDIISVCWRNIKSSSLILIWLVSRLKSINLKRLLGIEGEPFMLD